MPAVGAVYVNLTGGAIVVSVRVSAIGAVHMSRRVIVIAGRAMHVTVIMAMRMPMPMPMRVSVVMAVIVLMIMIMRVTMVFVENLLSDSEVFGERRIVSVLVSAAVSPGLGFERHERFGNVDIEPQQHVAQHGVVFELEIAVANLYRGMPVAKVICRAGERERCGCAHEQHGLGSRFHADETAIVGHEHIAATQYGAARQEQRHLFTGVERGAQSALAAGVERQHECGGATRQRRGNASGVETFLDTAQCRRCDGLGVPGGGG